jgi:hypothetical protein
VLTVTQPHNLPLGIMTGLGINKMTCNLTEEQIERWRQFKDQMNADEPFIARQQARDPKRLVVRQQILELLEDFRDGRINLEQLKNTFDLKTRSDWDVFGLKGMNGAMFLNMLVKHIPDQSELSKQLEQTLKLPSDESQGREQMLAFYDYLDTMIESEQVTRRQVQPARTPFFVSAWWHMQNVERWPIYYLSGRQAFAQEHVYTETNHPFTSSRPMLVWIKSGGSYPVLPSRPWNFTGNVVSFHSKL